jgi:hypothetical protein
MSPQTIPWILCSALCLLPIAIGSGTYAAWKIFTNRYPTLDTSGYTDSDNRKHVLIEFVMLTREERKTLKSNKQEGEEK